ncbi:hypothetical protein [Frigoriglobus tundricola]|uniref:Uncharacterized protein n=1 Tax=Frigoriglobus tundricola TaxID=2774151 RepID=A0A6M5Z1M6_9BACT|nr:hypothetical protein [Frigoriglobus tundricola]QJW99714.1 hypothetical protein FTUN_7337 [Frigoriglobus tundricola]
MDAANPLCRLLLLAAGLTVVIGCKSDTSGTGSARGQIPQDPLAPIAPPPPRRPVPSSRWRP